MEKGKYILSMAGTPVDSEMGVQCLKSRGITALPCPVSSDPTEQTEFQILPYEEKHGHIRKLVEDAKQFGCAGVFVYCNSLSSSVDFGRIEEETGLRCVTPMRTYAKIAKRYKRLAVISANAQGAAGVERAFVGANPHLEIISVSMLPLVYAIEEGRDPSDIIRDFGLTDLVGWFRSCGAEKLVLGCTHFPYLKEKLAEKTGFGIIDPADDMAGEILKI